MKNLILITILTLSFISNSFANNFPSAMGDDEIILISNSEMIGTLQNASWASALVKMEYIDSTKDIAFKAIQEISFVQVFDSNGEMIYQLPVGFRELSLTLTDFDKGSYQINLLLSNSNQMLVSTIEKI